MDKIPSLQDKLLEARRLVEHTSSSRMLMEYVPDAEITQRVQKIGQVLLYVFISFVMLIFCCCVFPELYHGLFYFFKCLIGPIRPLLLSTPSVQLAPIITTLGVISQYAMFILAPSVVLVTVAIAVRRSFLYLEGNQLMLLKYVPKGNSYQQDQIRMVGGKSYMVASHIVLSDDTDVTVERPVGKKSFRDYKIRFSTSAKNDLVLRWGDIVKVEDRNHFLSYLEKKLPRRVDASIFQPFKQFTERQSYTEIWLKELSGAPKRDRLTPLMPGSTLNSGDYTVLEKAGVGGQGTVYLADCMKGLGEPKTVVLKEFVLPVYPDLRVRKKAAERFQSEAAMLSRLDHPQIVKFIDLFVEDHRAYVVMELVEGTTLKERVTTEGTLSEAEVLGLAAQLAEVLVYLHAQSPAVVHRDVTPDNIILGADGVPKLIDFSVAQEISSGVTGSVVGKPNYIAPEQFRGKPTVQSDIYSLGATLYYLLIGDDPPAITVLHPHSVKPGVSQQLDQIIARCTQLDISKRYESAAAMLIDLEKLMPERRAHRELMESNYNESPKIESTSLESTNTKSTNTKSTNTKSTNTESAINESATNESTKPDPPKEELTSRESAYIELTNANSVDSGQKLDVRRKQARDMKLLQLEDLDKLQVKVPVREETTNA